jgi:hypothetical protein
MTRIGQKLSGRGLVDNVVKNFRGDVVQKRLVAGTENLDFD